jgi:hypothetical protein
LRADSALRGAASDGTDVGAAVEVVMAGIAGVASEIAAPPAAIQLPSAPSGLRIVR